MFKMADDNFVLSYTVETQHAASLQDNYIIESRGPSPPLKKISSISGHAASLRFDFRVCCGRKSLTLDLDRDRDLQSL